MATRLSNRRWLLRDVPRLGALSVWALAGFLILAYCFDRPPLQHMLQHVMSAALRPATVAGPSADPGNSPSIYTGSILFVPPRGELCGRWKFDNRNGAFWDDGQVSCRSASGMKPDEVTSAARMIAIGKAFKGE
jgi:hypothetical protein